MADYTREPRITSSSKKGKCKETGNPIERFEKVLFIPQSKEVYCTSSNRYREFSSPTVKEKYRDILEELSRSSNYTGFVAEAVLNDYSDDKAEAILQTILEQSEDEKNQERKIFSDELINKIKGRINNEY